MREEPHIVFPGCSRRACVSALLLFMGNNLIDALGSSDEEMGEEENEECCEPTKSYVNQG